jgi:hypothetical protein
MLLKSWATPPASLPTALGTAITLRYQQLDLVPDHLFPPVSEQLLGLEIDLDDRSILLNDHQSMGERFQQIADRTDDWHIARTRHTPDGGVPETEND